MNKLLVNKGELITALLYTKRILVHEDFVTKDEYDYYTEMIKKELLRRDINIKLSNKINEEDFTLENDSIKANMPIRELITKYRKNNPLLFLYDRKFQHKVLEGYYQSKLDRIDIILNEEKGKRQVLNLNA